MKIASISIADYCEATEGMPHDVERLYFRMLMKMLSRESGLPDDDGENARMFGYRDVRTYAQLKKKLLRWPNTIFIEDGLIKNERVEHDLAEYHARRSQASRNGQIGGRSRRVQPEIDGRSDDDRPEIDPRSTPDPQSIPHTTTGENNDLTQASPTPTPTPSPSPEIEDDLVGTRTRDGPLDDCQDERRGAGRLVRLDDHRPDVGDLLTEEHYRDFRALCDTFGRKPNQIVLRPTPRDDSDRVLASTVRGELRNCAAGMALQAIDGALRDAEARSLGNRQDGHAGKSAGGIASLQRYLTKCLRSQVADLRAAEAAAIAKMRTEGAVQIRIAEKRMGAVERGGARGRRRTSSWDDIAADLGWSTEEHAEAPGA